MNRHNRDVARWRDYGRTLLALSLFGINAGVATASAAAAPLNPKSIPKFVNQLEKPPVYAPTVVTDPATGAVLSHDYRVDVSQFTEQMLPPGFPATTVWGYGGKVQDPNGPPGATKYARGAPGPTFEAERGTTANVQWVNNLIDPITNAPVSHMFAVDPTLHWANPNNMATPIPPFLAWPSGYAEAQSPVPIVTHLHGAEVESASDGHPEAWFTPRETMRGPAFVKSRYTYVNTQNAATLWYHDHALGLTRENVYAGLAGFYLLSDKNDTLATQLPSGAYDIPLVIQDKMFLTDGSLSFPAAGVNPDIHPYWSPEFFGDVIVVNGKAWPNLDVERRQYRFRLLNGSNARFYELTLSNNQSFVQIGSDGGYLAAPATMKMLRLAPGERADVLIDFSGIKPGTRIVLRNAAKAPYPAGTAADPMTIGQIMQFTVPANAAPSVVPAALPATLNSIPTLLVDAGVRTLTLNEVMGPLGPVMGVLDGQPWHAPASEMTRVGSTEIWEVVNMTGDTHPIHLHLVQFQVLNRQPYQAARYAKDWQALNGMPPLMQPTVVLSPTPYLRGSPAKAEANERGWKDTVQVNPGEVTRFIVRTAPTDTVVGAVSPGMNAFAFDPTAGPGYVWHCHILDHEDNEMMRPFQIMN